MANRDDPHKPPPFADGPGVELQPPSNKQEFRSLSPVVHQSNRPNMTTRQRSRKDNQEEAGGPGTSASAIFVSGSFVVDDRAHSSNIETHEDSRNKPEKTSRMKTFMKRLGAIELENKGSVARDHLALERTFLAWLRTSLAFASIGIAVTQLFRLSTQPVDPGQSPSHSDATLDHLGKPLGATFLGISIIVLVVGAQRYYESQEWLLKGKFPASRGSVLLMTMVAFLLIVASFVVVLLGRENTNS